jgi:hypothetical protein
MALTSSLGRTVYITDRPTVSIPYNLKLDVWLTFYQIYAKFYSTCDTRSSFFYFFFLLVLQ